MSFKGFHRERFCKEREGGFMMDCFIEDDYNKGEISSKYAEQHCSLQQSCEKCKYWRKTTREKREGGGR